MIADKRQQLSVAPSRPTCERRRPPIREQRKNALRMRLGTRLRRVEHDRFDEMVRCPRGEIGTRTRKRTITSVKPIVVRHEPRVQPRVYTCSRSEEHTSELQSLMRTSYAV